MTEEKESPPEDEESISPIGVEFWLGQVLMVAGVAAGIWIATRTGFADAARFAQMEDYRFARGTLASVRREMEDNLRQVRDAKARIEDGKNAKISVDLTFLDAAASKPYMSLVDPELLSGVEKLFVHPLPKVAELLDKITEFDKFPDQRKWVLEVLTKILDRAKDHVLPMFNREERELERHETRLRVGR
ncbi:MAG: hypothetical protein HYY17_12970 [Planctomycetes bacterium]|nr:hypothetical protein [Planctomycetota bacterium]